MFKSIFKGKKEKIKFEKVTFSKEEMKIQNTAADIEALNL